MSFAEGKATRAFVKMTGQYLLLTTAGRILTFTKLVPSIISVLQTISNTGTFLGT